MGRRHGFGFWFALAAFVAVFVNEPMATLDVTVQLFKAVGEFGGAVVSELASGDVEAA